MGDEQTDTAPDAIWKGGGGRGWVGMQQVLDRMFDPLEELLVDAVCSSPAEPTTSPGHGDRRVLDVGCGTGGTTLAMARRLGAGGDCTGIDISEPMVAAARDRAEAEGARVRFIRADAQRHPWEAGSFDVVGSRFGVMFFDDPVQAFTKLHAATVDGGALHFIAWRDAEENPFMTTAERAAAPLLDIPPREADGPGQFGLADRQRTSDILERSGWGRIDIQPIDAVCTLPEKDLVDYLTQLGPVGRALADEDVSTRARVVDTVRPAFDPYVVGSDVRFTAACWLVTARA